MDLLFIGITLSATGEILIGLTVLNVHRHMVKEHKIDDDVIGAMKREKWLAICGILFITLGYFFQLYANGYFS
ncbi:hypothetical protein COT82_02545 [Candidatus Campbellbacteria bacterium CG10_big_fil_rev_8_21_14_0_10_35_52]|uniref:Uncharacterized protein n=1 Tax=Candidatus Campbellbacteria bacterium CG10_big_fil_rev_8_21_14_0_10_35_52 TaxID=1974527 RepID=A0A2M6WUS5_9BACT|nr:MAG: hypothetical protein COT82_02545 [Candidatus Campbellbacteria bacterium CG10_big_fil_rev_8_21_14_0_10_35_52]